MTARASAEQLHQLNLGRAGHVAVKLHFHEQEIAAAVDVPQRLVRRERRHLQRWLDGIFRSLDPDPRGMKIIVTIGGKVTFTGSEMNGLVAFFHP